MRKQEVQMQVLFDLVLCDYVDNHRKSLSTININVRKHLEPYFGKRSAERITAADIEAYKDKRKCEGARNATINLELATLRRAFKLGIERELVRTMPTVRLYRLGKSNRRTGFFEHDEFEKQLAALSPYAKLVLRFGYHTGWREGEIFDLTWTDNYDEAGQVVRLLDSKNGNGRVFPLRDADGNLNDVGEVIELAKQNRVSGCPYIFHSNGKPVNRVTFNRHWRRACKLSGVHRMFHDLRRTAVRNLSRAGVHRTIAKAITGHESDSVFERYDIVDESDLKLAISKMTSYLSTHSGSAQATAQSNGAPQKADGQELAPTSLPTPPPTQDHHEQKERSERADERSEEATASESDQPRAASNGLSETGLFLKPATSAPKPPTSLEQDSLFELMAELGVG